ncbi:MAG: endonuclease domain-containing protein [Chitinophagaceae bacterium]|nr:MAG: endonuclease domain-containing protein [Chitinophagaceae bacterium]
MPQKNPRKTGGFPFVSEQGGRLFCPMKAPGRHYAYHHSSYRKYRNRLDFAKENRKHPTEAENVIWQAVRGRQLGGYKFRRQHIIGDYIVDFVCLQRSLIVEIDGDIHQDGENPQLDKDRTADLRAAGFDIIRFTNDEVLQQTEWVCFRILNRLNGQHKQ